jgi:sterol desaturase/sphingolipid hydroxylase (fatty acid hydroxylase superfamily)
MSDARVLLQPAWDWLRVLLGDFVGSPGFLMTAVILGVYVPGIVFSFVDVVVTKRMTAEQCLAVYWRAMKWYGTLYALALPVFIFVPMPAWLSVDVPVTAPTLYDFGRDIVLYFFVGDFCSYWWHRFEHQLSWYSKQVHRVHHFDRPPLSIWTAMVVHPVEGFSVLGFFHIYGVTCPIHLLTFAVAAFALTAVTMITHCGYTLPVYDSIFAHAAAHDLHHARSEPTNISVVLTVCDRLFGTYQPASYEAQQKKQKQTADPDAPPPPPPTTTTTTTTTTQ